MKKTILVFTNYYLPGYKAGGPIRSVSNLVDWLGDRYQFRIITSDRDYMDKKRYPSVRVNEWNTVGKAEVFYFDDRLTSFGRIYRILNELNYDLVLFNSFFSLRYTIIPLLLARKFAGIDASRLAIAPRGEFSQDALDIKNSKKKMFLSFIRRIGLYDNLNWCFTNEKEQKEFFNNINVKSRSMNIIPNLPKREALNEETEADKEPKSARIVYLGRLAEIKNLNFALQVLKKIRDMVLTFDLYGVKDDAVYWEKCKSLMEDLPDNIKVTYRGHIPNDEVPGILSQYHLFFLPTKSENFGHAILEAMLAGTPVLISDQTPWRDLEEKGLGWDVPLEQGEKYIEIISRIALMNKQEINELKRGVRSSIHKYEVEKSVEQNISAFQKLVD